MEINLIKKLSIIKLILYLSVISSIGLLSAEEPIADTSHVKFSEEEINNLAQELGEETMSPFCPGRTLQACPSEDARQLKLEITSLLSKGYSKDAIKRRLYSMYSENISGLPQNNSFKSIAWLSPLVFSILGLVIVYFGLVHMKKQKNQPSLGTLQDKSIDLKAIEEKLKR